MQETTYKKFNEVFETSSEFVNEYRNSGLNSQLITTENLTKLYYLLYAQYGNSYFIGKDIDQTLYKLFSIIYNKGLIWSKSVMILNSMLELEDEDIFKNRETINNMADNPGENFMTTGDNVFMDFVRSQNVNIFKDNKANAYLNYLTLLNDVTSEFIQEFKTCFRIVFDDCECECYE